MMIRDDLLPAEVQKPSLEEIEIAYIDLMQCYSACLSNLVLRKWRFRDKLVPTIIRWRTKKRIDMLKATLLLLIASIKKEEKGSVTNLENYCDDIEKISNQIARSGYMTLIYNSIPAILLVLPLAFLKEIGTVVSGNKIPGFLKEILLKLPDFHFIYLLILLVLLLLILSLYIKGHRSSSKIFEDSGITERDLKFYDLIYRYSSSLNPSCKR